jgi:hypothetical protein
MFDKGVPTQLLVPQHYPRGITLPRGGTPLISYQRVGDPSYAREALFQLVWPVPFSFCAGRREFDAKLLQLRSSLWR